MRNCVDINLMPPNTSALVDANIFIYHLGGLSADCSAFLKRVALGEIESYITTIIIAEVLHRRMLGEAIAKGLVTPGQALKKLKANRGIISSLTDYITDVNAIIRLPLKIIEATADDITASHALRQTYGLFVNDLINLACAQRLRLSNMVTHDDDFDNLPINVRKPQDI
jgi:predicted nucleic acid-binding protein